MEATDDYAKLERGKMTFDGKILERAISLIETQILHDIKSQDIGKVTIDTNKIISVAGVRHEIDIYVTVDLKIGTKLIYIFECKNRKDKVDKNDIIIFNAKIDYCQAQNGYFVGRSYTNDASNQAQQFPRLKLLTFHDNPDFDADAIMNMKSSSIKLTQYHCAIFPDPSEALKKSTTQMITLEDGRTIGIGTLVNEKYDAQREHKNDGARVVIKKLDWEVLRFEVFDPIINGERYKYLGVDAYVEYQHEYPEIMYDFNVPEKGRYFKLRMKSLSGKSFLIFEITKDPAGNFHFHNIGEE